MARPAVPAGTVRRSGGRIQPEQVVPPPRTRAVQAARLTRRCPVVTHPDPAALMIDDHRADLPPGTLAAGADGLRDAERPLIDAGPAHGSSHVMMSPSRPARHVTAPPLHCPSRSPQWAQMMKSPRCPLTTLAAPGLSSSRPQSGHLTARAL